MKPAQYLLLDGRWYRRVNRLFPRAPLEKASPMEANASCSPHATPRAWAAGCALAIECWDLPRGRGAAADPPCRFACSPSSLGHPHSTR